MGIVNKYVKDAFMEIYFKDGNYLTKMHSSLISQISSYTTIYKNYKGEDCITINNKEYIIPLLPESFSSNEYLDIFIKGITNSKYFIN